MNDILLTKVKETITDVTMESQLSKVKINGEDFFKIAHVDKMRTFLMSIVSDSNHWMFIGSNGALSAGRKNSDYSFFPYYTDDKILEAVESTGSKTLVRVNHLEGPVTWEPFSIRTENSFDITRNLYKNVFGNKVRFEEVNQTLGLSFIYEWNSSETFGFIRKAELCNLDNSSKDITILDGIQNIMPYGVSENLQVQRSNIVDAYKRSELVSSVGMGVYALSAIIVDKAEPSEALKANVAWHRGMPDPTYLLSSLQIDRFRHSGEVELEVDIKAEKGAFFVKSSFNLSESQSKNWMIGADVNKDQSAIASLIQILMSNDSIEDQIKHEIEQGTERLKQLVASSDGIQYSADRLRDTRHYANTLFNIMRGGIFDFNYYIESWDFKRYLAKANKKVSESNKAFLSDLPIAFTLQELLSRANTITDPDFKRLCFEYLPLKFSRRHGDPSRPWNKFSINTKDEIDGSKVLDYEGNWRDIFQNWEALAHSFPQFVEGMIHKFLNATTFDGYNPYRVTKDGFDWEIIEEHDPWSYIGYWGDHQIIYLLKFLEIIKDRYKDKLTSYFSEDIFVYANVPYKIKSFEALLKNPKDTIEFDHALDVKIRNSRDSIGADGALLVNQTNDIHRVNFIEKILATVLAKTSNFILEGGIWMNTQRPEWNDANNALVGNGVSMVTLCYLRRFMAYMDDLLSDVEVSSVMISTELKKFFSDIHQSLVNNKDVLTRPITDEDRMVLLKALGESASHYRMSVYKSHFKGSKEAIDLDDLKNFTTVLLEYLNQSIEANRRPDGMYHAYNLMSSKGNEAVEIDYLEEMLEGQVAVLSSGYLSSQQALDALDALKSSALFRQDQYSYLLYPNKQLPGFLDRNSIEESDVLSSKLLQSLLADNNHSVLKKDVFGNYHFNGNFNNSKDLEEALNALEGSDYESLAVKERGLILGIFEKVFNHKAFTGRSGTFYGYEGLGSIYWHMVSKLLLAVQECCLKAVREGASDIIVGKLLEHYYEINEGIGVHKPAALYGAFPTDPYSHTPFTKGAQQPGMTGQVKEDILSRIGELGVFVSEGQISFNPCLLRANEFIKEDKTFSYIDVNKEEKQLLLSSGMMAFTYCQIPILYKLSDQDQIHVVTKDHETTIIEGHTLTKELSSQIFNRGGEITHLVVNVNQTKLK